MATVDVHAVVLRMAERRATRTEADLQSDVRLLLLLGDLNLEDGDLEVSLEAQAGDGKRIDVEAGFTVIECKKNLKPGRQMAKDVEQLADYLRRRTEQTGQRYVGVLTDGADWHLYLLEPSGLATEVSHFKVSVTDPDVDGLRVWIEGVLATRQHIKPSPLEIRRRLGAGTSSFALDRKSLAALYGNCRTNPEVQVKRMLWARLLTTAFGSHFQDDDELFLEHTYLVVVAELIAHVVIGLDIRETREETSASSLLSGEFFAQARISGVVEADFFDWVAKAPGGEQFVRDLARRIARFDWAGVEHDVLKILYESVIGAEQRKNLGEYYTPDWLAERIVADTVQEPLNERVLDPSCGSGTFLFYAIKRYLAAADAAGLPNAEAVAGVCRSVYGVDVHPVAVTLARVTYLLAIGLDRLQDRGEIGIPVNIGDSLQWGQDKNLLTDGGLVVYTTDGAELFASELRWPASVATDASVFDQLVSDLADRAVAREPGARPLLPITAILNRYKVSGDEDRKVIETTYRVLCGLHDQGRNHIWGYYVRNLARPYWLSQPENRPTVLVGNPPWLSYRYMTAEMKERFREDSQDFGIWAGAEVATSQDLSGYFVARCVQLYLNKGGRFGFVMPLAAISRPHFDAWRKGAYTSLEEATNVAFGEPWDISAVKPLVFPMPASVVFGERAGNAKRMGDQGLTWSGSLPAGGNIVWPVAEKHLGTAPKVIARPTGALTSPYGLKFRQGAAIVPRALVTVEEVPAGPLGVPQGKVRVRTVKSVQDKKPWNGLPTREGIVEKEFVRPLHLGTTLLPFRCLPPSKTLIPVVNGKVTELGDPGLEAAPAMAQWWAETDRIWRLHSTGSMSLAASVDYQGKLRAQFPMPAHRVVYNRSGTRLVAAYVPETDAVIDTKLYWGAVSGHAEADYLCAVFNSRKMTELVNPVQSQGHFGPRDFYSLPFEFPIPLYDPADETHAALSNLGRRSAEIASTVDLGQTTGFQQARKRISEVLGSHGLAEEADQLVTELLLVV